MTKKGITLVLFASILALFAISASAIDIPNGLIPTCQNQPGGCTLCDLWPLANNIINTLLFALAIPLLTIMIIWGGVMWTTAGASPSNIEQGKKIISSAIIGILIAFAGWLIVDTIIKSLAGGSVIIAWQAFPDKTTCENPNLATETITFQDIIPAGNAPAKNWIAYQCLNKVDCVAGDNDKSTKLAGGPFTSEETCRQFAGGTVGEETYTEFGGAIKTNWKCIEEMLPTTPGAYYSDIEARAALGVIQVNKSNCSGAIPTTCGQPCSGSDLKCGNRPPGSPTSCTSLDMIPKSTITKLKSLSGITFYISGGTEAGHVTHGLCRPNVDLVPGAPGNKQLSDLPLLYDAVLSAGINLNGTFCEDTGGNLYRGHDGCARTNVNLDHLHVQFTQ